MGSETDGRSTALADFAEHRFRQTSKAPRMEGSRGVGVGPALASGRIGRLTATAKDQYCAGRSNAIVDDREISLVRSKERHAR